MLLAKGYAKIDKNYKLKEDYSSWTSIEKKALDKKLGMWKYDDEEDLDY